MDIIWKEAMEEAYTSTAEREMGMSCGDQHPSLCWVKRRGTLKVHIGNLSWSPPRFRLCGRAYARRVTG